MEDRQLDSLPLKAHHARQVLKGGRNAIVDGLGAVMPTDKARSLANQEHAWQRQVLERARAKGDAPLPRAAFLDLIQRELPWRAQLPAYRDYYH